MSNREEGCIPCSRGKFCPTIGSQSISSCISCPRGKYSNTLGLTSIEDCQDCPVDTYTKYNDNNIVNISNPKYMEFFNQYIK